MKHVPKEPSYYQASNERAFTTTNFRVKSTLGNYHNASHNGEPILRQMTMVGRRVSSYPPPVELQIPDDPTD